MNSAASNSPASLGFFARIRQFFTAKQSPETPSTSKPAPQKDIAQELTPDWLIIGLGNPGTQYAHTRHNAGIDAVELEPVAWQFSKLAHADIAYITVTDAPAAASPCQQVAYVRSHFYMNESGRTIEKLQQIWNLPPERIVVVHDELDLPLGKVRVKLGDSHNGHNGLKSIDAALGTPKYLRIRVGIGRPASGTSVVDHVLGPLPAGEQAEQGLTLGHEAVKAVPTQGLAKTQNLIHRK